MIIVGFGHKSGHGKDTLANFVNTILRMSNSKLRVKKVSMASKIKSICHELFPVMDEVYYEDHREHRNDQILGGSVVDLWVRVGEALRCIDPSVWRRYVLNPKFDADVLLIPDIRTFDEVIDIQAKEGLLYKVTNSRVPPRTGKSIDHILDDFTGWTRVVANEGSLDDLFKEAEAIAETIKGRL